MPRKRTATVEETTTRRVTLTDEDTPASAADTAPINWARGYDHRVLTGEERHLQLLQRRTQQQRAEELIADWAASVDPGTPMPQWLKDATTNMLRAGPHATPLQAKWGRDC